MLFTQAAKGAASKNVLEPYLLTGSGAAPFVETDADGYAIEASLIGNDPNLSVPPGQIQQATAASLDAAADTVKNPGNLADLQDQASFRPRLPDGSADTDRHYASGPVFGLKTADGGALMFYGLTARLSLAPPGDVRTRHPRLLRTQLDADIGNGHVRRPVRNIPRGAPSPALSLTSAASPVEAERIGGGQVAEGLQGDGAVLAEGRDLGSAHIRFSWLVVAPGR